MRAFILFFFLCALLVLQAHGQSFTVQHYGIAEGLPSAEVYDVFQDSKGFLWFSTDNGVVKYDGFNFRNFTVADGLPDPVVFETFEDSVGNIWFRTFSGKIAHMKDNEIYPYQYNNVLSKACEKHLLMSMAFDKTGQLWFTTFTNLGKINTQGELTIRTLPIQHLEYKSVEKRNIIAVCNVSPRFTNITIDDKTFPISFTGPIMRAITYCSVWWNGDLYLSLYNYIFKYDGKVLSEVYRANSSIISLSVDAQNKFWVGYLNDGAERFTNENFMHGWAPDFLKGKSVTKVLCDPEGGYWVTTLENGIFYVPNPAIEHFLLPPDFKVRGLASSPDMAIIGGFDGTLIAFHVSEKRIAFQRKFDTPIFSVFYNKGLYWVSTGGTLYILNEQFQEIRKYKNFNLQDFSADSFGNIWAIESRGISRFNEKGDSIAYKHSSWPHRNVLALGSSIFVGTHTGLWVMDHNLNVIKYPAKLKDFKISKVEALNDSTLLLATIGNGYVLTNTRFDSFSYHKKFARNIYAVVKSDSTIWLGTEKGLVQTSLKSILSERNTFNFISRQSGLMETQVTHLAHIQGQLLTACNSGFSIVPYTNKRYANQSPMFYIKKLTVNNQNYRAQQQLKLPFDQNNIELDYGFIAFNHQDITVRYRLNLQSQWIYPSERAINLFSLSPGKYKFELQYSTDRLHWVRASNIPFIHITPPWWSRIEFQIAIIVACVVIIYLFFHARLVIYRQRVEKMELLSKQQQQLIKTEIDTLERERSRIAKDIHDGVGTNILATKLGVSRILKKHQDPESEAIENQFRDTMVGIKEIIYNLAPPGLERYGLVTALKDYTERLAASTSIQFEVNAFGDELADKDLSVPLFRVLQELITNSLKHSNTKTISIHLNSFDDLYNIVYEDKGIGFSVNEKYKGLGLHSIESRIQAIHGKITCESGSFGVSYTIDVPINKKINS